MKVVSFYSTRPQSRRAGKAYRQTLIRQYGTTSDSDLNTTNESVEPGPRPSLDGQEGLPGGGEPGAFAQSRGITQKGVGVQFWCNANPNLSSSTWYLANKELDRE